ncbi:MAG: VanZ family protein, partial [Colwellia sp.]|nr:VanZ family protein [Colwellia sp.]
MNIFYKKTKKAKKNNIKNLFTTWIIYFSIIVIAVTLSPYNFDFSLQKEFSWKMNSLDMFENLFLLFPIGFLFAISSNKIKLIDIVKYTVIGFIFSLLVESSQLFLKTRTSQYWDVIANTISMFLGVLLGIGFKPLANKLMINRLSISNLVSALFAIGLLL